jgi:ComEC/Rec2-related protein
VRAEAVSGRGRSSPARAPVLVVGGRGWDAVHRGDRVRATGRLAVAEPGDDVRALLLARRPPERVGTPGAAQRGLRRLREGLLRAAQPLPPDARGLLPGLVVGDTSALPADLATAMRATGLTHLTAVSGGNTALVTGGVLAAATALGVPRRARLLVAGAALGAFAALAGSEPSVLRAGVMGVTALLGLLCARRGAGVPALSATVVVLLVLDPWLGRSPGFALSVLATGALLVLARPWARALSHVVPQRLAAVLAVPLAAQAVCGPVVLLLSPGVPLTAVPANLLAGPAVAPATVLGLLATVLEPVWPQGAELAARLAGVAAGWIATVARSGAALPAGTLPWPQGAAGAAALAGTTVALALLPRAVRRLRRGGRSPGRRDRPA